jgi:two-component system, OmpR family, response regulator
MVLTLLVEDNSAIRRNLIETLTDLTNLRVVHWCDSELDAKHWLHENMASWDLVILDIFLKQGSGLGVLEYLSKRASHQKVVVLSNYATPEIRRHCLALGADHIFDKSSELEDLVSYCQSFQRGARGS